MPSPTQGSTYDNITITSLEGEDLDLRGGVVSFQYYEDIFSPTFTAHMTIVSTSDVYNSLPIRGGEKVVIKVTTPIEIEREKTPGEFEVTMYVNKITGFVQEKQLQTFTLHLVSKEAISNTKKRVIKKYHNQKISDIINDVLKLLEVEDDDIEIVEETQKTINFFGNMRKPYTIVPMLASRAIPVGANSKSAGFLFWHTRKGIHFKSVEEIIKQKEKKETYIFSRINENPAAACRENAAEINEANFVKVLLYEVKNNNDVIKDSSQGEYSTYRTYWNPNTFEFIHNKFEPKNDQESLGTSEPKFSVEADPGSIPTNELGHRIVSGILDVGFAEPKVSKEINNDETEDVSQAISRYSSMFTQTVTFTTAMNIFLTAGDVIECKFPLTDSEDELDEEQSGLYIIKEITHFWSPNRSYSAMRVIRDSSGI